MINNHENMEEVSEKTVSGMKWTYLSTILSRGLSPLILIALARLLSPADFGLVAMALAVTSLLDCIYDIGLTHALVQQKGEIDKIASMVFWALILLGIFWFLLIWILAPFVAVYFKNGEVVSLLRTLGLMFLIRPFSDVPLFVLLRDLRFKALFYRQLIPQLFQGGVSIILAFMGYGAWALAIGNLAGVFGTAIVVWRATDWRPNFLMDLKMLKSMFQFGSFVSIQNILGWMMVKSSDLFVGRFLGAANLGIFRMGSNYGSLPHQLIGTPFHNVVYPVLCKISSKRSELRDKYFSYIEWISIASIPASLALLFVVPFVIPVLLGQKWSQVIPILQLIIFQSILISITGINSETYKAIGKPDINVKYFFIRVLVSLPCYYFAAQKNIITLAYMHVALACFFAPINFFICSKVLEIRYLSILGKIKTGFIIGLIFTVIGMSYNPLIGDRFINNAIGNFILLSLIFLITGILSLFLINRRMFDTFTGIIKGAVALQTKKAAF